MVEGTRGRPTKTASTQTPGIFRCPPDQIDPSSDQKLSSHPPSEAVKRLAVRDLITHYRNYTLSPKGGCHESSHSEGTQCFSLRKGAFRTVNGTIFSVHFGKGRMSILPTPQECRGGWDKGDASLRAESSLLSKKLLLNLPTCLNVCVGRIWGTVPPIAAQVFPY